MDGWSNQDPPITTYIQYIHKRKKEKDKTPLRGKSPPQKEEGDEVVPPLKSSVPISDKFSDVETDL